MAVFQRKVGKHAIAKLKLNDNYYTGCDRPALKHLNKYVRKGVSVKWHDLGLELLEQEDEEMLYEIKTNHSNDVSECCKEMFRLWLRKCTNATWDQLIQALRDVDLNSVATTIVEILNPTEDTVLYPNAGTYIIIQDYRCSVDTLVDLRLQ